MHVEGLLVTEIKWKNVFSHMIPVNIELIDKVKRCILVCVPPLNKQRLWQDMANIVNIDISVFVFVFFFFMIAKLAWENSEHFATHPLVSPRNGV